MLTFFCAFTVSAAEPNLTYVRKATIYPVFVENGREVYYPNIKAEAVASYGGQDIVSIVVPASIYNRSGIVRWRLVVDYYLGTGITQVRLTLDDEEILHANGNYEISQLIGRGDVQNICYPSRLQSVSQWSCLTTKQTPTGYDNCYVLIEKQY